jgi:hypothetical protein
MGSLRAGSPAIAAFSNRRANRDPAWLAVGQGRADEAHQASSFRPLDRR